MLPTIEVFYVTSEHIERVDLGGKIAYHETKEARQAFGTTDQARKRAWACDVWRVVFTYQGRTHSTEYRTGIGHRKAARNVARGFYEDSLSAKKSIKVEGVLSCLFSDAGAADETFESWCSDLGYDPDSRRALDTYLTCQKTATDLRRLFGADYAAIGESVRDA